MNPYEKAKRIVDALEGWLMAREAERLTPTSMRTDEAREGLRRILEKAFSPS